jgi:hypothetical protein
MRSAGNFSPDWGYPAPAPSFMHTARIVIVATAVGATAGAAVVLSLIDHPAVENNRAAIVPHAIVTSVEAATPPTVPLAIRSTIKRPTAAPGPLAESPPEASKAPAADSQPASSSAASAPPAPQSSPNVTASVEMPPATEAAPADTSADVTTATPEPASPKKGGGHRGSYAYKPKPFPIETMLRRLFTAHGGTSYYPR